MIREAEARVTKKRDISRRREIMSEREETGTEIERERGKGREKGKEKEKEREKGREKGIGR
jgi:hypothetical protein